jgi:hypothetical protein
LFEDQSAEFLSQPPVELPVEPIPQPAPGSLAYLKLKLKDPNAVFTADELVDYYYNTLNMASVLNHDELNKFYNIVTNSITEEPSPVNNILIALQDSLINIDKESVTRILFPTEMEGGKSRSRTTNKGRKSRKTRKTRKSRKSRKTIKTRKSRKTRKTRKHRTLRK